MIFYDDLNKHFKVKVVDDILNNMTLHAVCKKYNLRQTVARKVLLDAGINYNHFIEEKRKKELAVFEAMRVNVSGEEVKKEGKITDEDLENDVADIVDRLGRIPKVRELKRMIKYSYALYEACFGRLSNALLTEKVRLKLRKPEVIKRENFEFGEDVVNDILGGDTMSAVLVKYKIRNWQVYAILKERGLYYRDVLEKRRSTYFNEVAERKKEILQEKFRVLWEEKANLSDKIKCEDIENDMVRIITEQGNLPPIAELKKLIVFPYYYYRRFLGVINRKNMKRYFGRRVTVLFVDSRRENGKNNRQALIDYLIEKEKKLGRPPIKNDMVLDRVHNYMQYYRCFGGYKNALKAAGMNNRCLHKALIIEKEREKIIEGLKELGQRLNKTPDVDDVNNHTLFKADGCIQYFRSVNMALRAAGFRVKMSSGPPEVYSNEILLDYLKELAAVLGRVPTVKEIDDAGRYSCALYYKRFGTLRKAIELAGMVPNRILKTEEKYDKTVIVNFVRSFVAQYNKLPGLDDVKRELRVPQSALYKLFGSMGNLANEAGGNAGMSAVG